MIPAHWFEEPGKPPHWYAGVTARQEAELNKHIDMVPDYEGEALLTGNAGQQPIDAVQDPGVAPRAPRCRMCLGRGRVLGYVALGPMTMECPLCDGTGLSTRPGADGS